MSCKLQGEEVHHGQESDVFRRVVRVIAAAKMRIEEGQKILCGPTETTVSSETHGWDYTYKLVQGPA